MAYINNYISLFIFDSTAFLVSVIAAFISFYLNFITCTFFSFLIYFKVIVDLPNLLDLELLHWITASSNLIFLSAVFSFLIPKLFSRLENSLKEQYSLQEKLKMGTVKLKESFYAPQTFNH